MKDLSQEITLPSHAPVSSLLKSITVTMASLGQVGGTFLSFLLKRVILSLIQMFLRLAVVRSELVCISFAIFVLDTSIVLKEMSCH